MNVKYLRPCRRYESRLSGVPLPARPVLIDSVDSVLVKWVCSPLPATLLRLHMRHSSIYALCFHWAGHPDQRAQGQQVRNAKQRSSAAYNDDGINGAEIGKILRN